ncbi:uncharacterized protein LOC142222586 [Haematobia irritans]|uniref:uncharacterized protein LOC142222586 n=1 Tax=Haematobia irritans TaxID=7368 RepID=UPI003F4FCD8D
MPRCCIPNCPSLYSVDGVDFRLHKFGVYRKEWVEALKDILPNLEQQINTNTRICSMHFDGVPSIYNPIVPTLRLFNFDEISDNEQRRTISSQQSEMEIVEEPMPPEVVMGEEEEEVVLDFPSPIMEIERQPMMGGEEEEMDMGGEEEEMDTSQNQAQQQNIDDEEKSIKAYYFLNHHYPCSDIFNLNIVLPKEEILNRRTYKFATEGICESYVDALKTNTLNMTEAEKEICLSFDELNITVGHNTEKAVVFHMHGIVSGWQILLCFYKTKKGLRTRTLTKLLKRSITTAEAIGFYVQCITCDQYKANTSFEKYCCLCDENGASYLRAEIFNGHRVYMVYDMCHLIDNLRKYLLNNHLNPEMEYTEEIQCRLFGVEDIRSECFEKKRYFYDKFSNGLKF